jgi:hypothetical protein
MKLILVTIIAMTLITSQAKAEIRDVTRMADVFLAVDADTLVVFDLDNTVIESVGDWGSDQWYDHLVEYFRTLHPAEEAVAKGLKLWADAQHTTEVNPVESVTPSLIREAQTKGTRMIGLTARPDTIDGRTADQLKSIGVDFSANGGTVLAIGPSASKGRALVEYLSRLERRPKKVIFVDDKHHYVKSVDEALTGLGIEHIIFRYGAADARVADYHRRHVGKNPCFAALISPTSETEY